MMLIILIHDLVYASICIYFSFFLECLIIFVYRFLTCWLNLFLGIVCFDAIVNGIGYLFFSLPS